MDSSSLTGRQVGNLVDKDVTIVLERVLDRNMIILFVTKRPSCSAFGLSRLDLVAPSFLFEISACSDHDNI